MTAIGLFSMFLGYALIYWALQAFEGGSQDSFISYVFPGANPGRTPSTTPSTTPSGSPSSSRAGKATRPGRVNPGA